MTETTRPLVDTMAWEPMTHRARDLLADRLEALAARVRAETPRRGEYHREYDAGDGGDRWLLQIEWAPGEWVPAPD